MADDLYDGEFWLPSSFLWEETDHKSPVESVMGSTETESDEDDFMEGLTRRMAHYTLEDDYPISGLGYISPKTNALATSPQSILSDLRRRSPWNDEKAAMMVQNNHGIYDNNKSLFGPIPSSGSSSSTEFCQTNLRKNHGVGAERGTKAFSYPQLLHNNPKIWKNNFQNAQISEPLFLSPSTWPPLQHPHKRNVEKTQTVFLDSAPSIKKPCVGTGVFIPRQTPHESQIPKSKPREVNTAFIPARVMEALNLNLEEICFQIPRESPSSLTRSSLPASDMTLNLRSDNKHDVAQRNCKPWKHSTEKNSHEILLPKEWTY